MNSKGCKYEKMARRYLEKKGLRCVAQNYSCRTGEIDLIMLEGQTYVFTEVRFRKSSHFGSALESITQSKQDKILKAVQQYLVRHKLHNSPIRIDAVGISKCRSPIKPFSYDIEWIKNAFTA